MNNNFIDQITSTAAENQDVDTSKDEVRDKLGCCGGVYPGPHSGSEVGLRDGTHTN